MDNLWNGITIYGPGQGGFEEGLVPNHIKDFNAKCFISIYDAWAFNNLHIELQKNRIPWIPYLPIDADDLNPRYLEILKYAFKIIPMSKHSEECLRKHFPDKTLPFIPPGIDFNIYKPYWETKEEKNKHKLGLGFSEDTFVISIMGDIKGCRKRWSENLEGIKIFREKNPQAKIGIYIQTNMRLISGLDFNVAELLKKFGLDQITRIVDTYSYVKGTTDLDMVKAYNASDVYLQCSYGEGYSMMNFEAAKCGTPSISTNFSSMKDAVIDGKTGHLVDFWLEMDQSIARKACPKPEDIAQKLQIVYERGSTSYKDECLKFTEKLDWNTIIKNHWLPTLELIEKEIDKACLNPSEPSEWLNKKSKEIFTVSG